jgi:nicotinate phosphoribosyltransferase
MLNAAGFDDTTIVLSSQLDELTIFQIRSQIVDEAPRYGVDADHLLGRLTYGVGSRMVTSDGDPSLDGVYKVVAVEEEGAWVPAIKISNTPAKIVNPGNKSLWRVYDERGTATADVMALVGDDLSDSAPRALPPQPARCGTFARRRANQPGRGDPRQGRRP